MLGNAADATRSKLFSLKWWARRDPTAGIAPAPLTDAHEHDGSHEYVLWDVHDRTLLLTLNDPSTRNSLSTPLANDLLDKLQAFERDPGLKVLVLTGADPGFCSGFNVGEFAAAIDELEEVGAPRIQIGRAHV